MNDTARTRRATAGVSALLSALLAALVVAIGLLAGCASAPQPQGKDKDGPLHHYQLARLFYEQGRTADSLREIEIALRKNDRLPQVWFYRGYIAWNAGQWTKAEEDFRRALSIEPLFTEARIWLATALDQQGRTEDALAELDRSLMDQGYPDRPLIHLNKALVLRRAGRLENALAELRRSVDNAPRFYRGHYEMAQVLAALGRADQAEMAFEAAAPEFTKSAQYHYLRGKNYVSLARPDDARRSLRRAIELGPGSEAAAAADEILRTIG